MAKIENITPEERESALSLIHKMGLEETEQQINYYVRMQRDSKKHKEEKASMEVSDLCVIENDDVNREYAINVLKYMKRSKSDRQVALYADLFTKTIQFCLDNSLDNDIPPYIFAEAIRKLENEKGTTIHHISPEDIAKCIAENKFELYKIKEDAEAKEIERINNKALPTEKQRVRKLATITMVIGCIIVVAPFFITGFSFNILWYLLIIIAAITSLCALGVDGTDKRELQSVLKMMAVVIAIGIPMYLWGPLNPNYSYSSNGSSDNPYNMPKEYHTEPCEECGEVGTYYIAEDGTQTGDRRYALHGHWYCISCYKIKKEFSDALGF